MAGEVVAAGIVCTTESVTAGLSGVHPQTLGSDAGHQFRADAAKLRGIDSVEVVKQRPVRQRTEDTEVVAGSGSPPGDFGVDAQIMPEQNIASETQVSSASKTRGDCPG